MLTQNLKLVHIVVSSQQVLMCYNFISISGKVEFKVDLNRQVWVFALSLIGLIPLAERVSFLTE